MCPRDVGTNVTLERAGLTRSILFLTRENDVWHPIAIRHRLGVIESWGVKKAESDGPFPFSKPQGTGVVAHPDPKEASAFRTWRSRLAWFVHYNFCPYQCVSTVLPCYLFLFSFPLHHLFLHLINPPLPHLTITGRTMLISNSRKPVPPVLSWLPTSLSSFVPLHTSPLAQM